MFTIGNHLEKQGKSHLLFNTNVNIIYHFLFLIKKLTRTQKREPEAQPFIELPALLSFPFKESMQNFIDKFTK